MEFIAVHLPSTRQLVAFSVTARKRSFRKAAEELNLSQPALSHAISQLEQQIGAQLLDRTSRGVQLTAAGAVLLEKVNRTLADLKEGIAEAKTTSHAERSRICIGFIYSATRLFLPEALEAFRSRHPSVQVVARDASPSLLSSDLLEGKVDLAITSPVSPLSRDLRFDQLLLDPFYAVLPASHPLAEGAELEWQALLENDIIAPVRGSAIRDAIDRGLADSTAFKPTMEVVQLATVFNLIDAGLGVTAMPRLACPLNSASYQMRPLIKPTIHRKIGILRRRDKPSTPEQIQFMELIKDAAKKQTWRSSGKD
jgi:LysR family transcriptional regulator, carnitine catabolism transcriptional activator